MANPGSPQKMSEMNQAMPPMPPKTMYMMLIMLVVMLAVMQFRNQIGGALNVVFQVIDFNGDMPVLTLVIAGVIMITFSTLVRSFMTDFIKQARNQSINKEFQNEFREARLENNLFKLKRLQEIQPQINANSMSGMAGMMKTMPLTMIVIMPIYAWVSFFIGDTVPPELMHIHLPWGTVMLNGTLWFMPYWIVIYTLISLPIGQLESRIVRYYLLTKRLKELDALEKRAA